MTQLRNFINQRCLALEQGLIDCYQLTGPFPVTFDVTPAGAGTIQVNSVNPPNYPWVTEYFGGIQTLLSPTPAPGFMFSHWTVTTGPLALPATTANNAITINIYCIKYYFTD